MDCTGSQPRIESPFLKRCGLIPLRLDGTRWNRLVVWSTDIQKKTALPVASVSRYRLILAGGGRALDALQNGLTITSVRREMKEVQHCFILESVLLEQQRRWAA